MQAERFTALLETLGIRTLVGVPDSTLKQFCDYIRVHPAAFRHIVPANEGAAVGLAVGEYLAAGRPACVYMQNSGLGNAVNPVTSIANREVYDIPMLFVIGWRGDPGRHDEPQHKFMGRITPAMLDVLEIGHTVMDADTTEEGLLQAFAAAGEALGAGRQYAFLVKRDTFTADKVTPFQNGFTLCREAVIERILQTVQRDDVIVSTTGKISREVYEASNRLFGRHAQAFLTVGGMGHTAMIALAMAENMPKKRVYCLDGDGAVLMHMGALALIGARGPKNLVHICLNNHAHESVGGMPTGVGDLRFSDVAAACGYGQALYAETEAQLAAVLDRICVQREIIFAEIGVSVGARADLGRPRESAVENKTAFMKYHGEKNQ